MSAYDWWVDRPEVRIHRWRRGTYRWHWSVTTYYGSPRSDASWSRSEGWTSSFFDACRSAWNAR